MQVDLHCYNITAASALMDIAWFFLHMHAASHVKTSEVFKHSFMLELQEYVLIPSLHVQPAARLRLLLEHTSALLMAAYAARLPPALGALCAVPLHSVRTQSATMQQLL